MITFIETNGPKEERNRSRVSEEKTEKKRKTDLGFRKKTETKPEEKPKEKEKNRNGFLEEKPNRGREKAARLPREAGLRAAA